MLRRKTVRATCAPEYAKTRLSGVTYIRVYVSALCIVYTTLFIPYTLNTQTAGSCEKLVFMGIFGVTFQAILISISNYISGDT